MMYSFESRIGTPDIDKHWLFYNTVNKCHESIHNCSHNGYIYRGNHIFTMKMQILVELKTFHLMSLFQRLGAYEDLNTYIMIDWVHTHTT